MSDKPPAGFSSSSTSSSPESRGGTSRFVGVGLSLAIGFIVFAIGVSLFPVEPPPTPPAPPRIRAATTAGVPPTPPATTLGSGGNLAPGAAATGALADGSTGAAAADGGMTVGDAAAADGRAVDESAASRATPDAADAGAAEAGTAPPAPTDAATADNDDGGGDQGPSADCTLPDKDIAREAWRHNWPTICPIPDSGKAFIIIPVKGSIENAVVDLKRKPVREARVTLPAAESQLTLKLYKLRRLGFKDLKIGSTDEGAGARFRVRLMNGAGDPVFDIKDTYAKITVATPSE